MPTSLEDLQRDWIQLKGERDTFEARFYASEKKVLELTRLLHEEQTLNAYIAPKRMLLYPKIFPLILSTFLITRLLELKIKLGFALLKTPPCTVDLN